MKTKAKPLAKVRSAGTLPWLGFDRVRPNGWIRPGNMLELTHWMVLHRPFEPAALIRQIQCERHRRECPIEPFRIDDMKWKRAAGPLSIEQAKIQRRAWIASALLHLFFFVLVGIEVYLKAQTFLDPVFYIFCIPGLLVGFPVAMLFGVGGPHGEGVFFGILFGLPANVFAYYWIAARVFALIDRLSHTGENSR